MKKIFCTTAMVLGLLISIPALAIENEEIPDRTMSGSGPTETGLAPATSQRFDQPLIRSADFIGNTVRGSEGNEIGKVSQMLFDAASGQVRYLVVSTSEPGGMAVDHLVPWQAVNTDPEGRNIALDMTADQFRNAPAGLAIGPEERAEELHRFYGVSPFWEEEAPARQPDGFRRGVDQKKLR